MAGIRLDSDSLPPGAGPAAYSTFDGRRAARRDATTSHLFHHLQRTHVKHPTNTRTKCAVELQVVRDQVAIPPLAQQVTSVLMREQVFTRSPWEIP